MHFHRNTSFTLSADDNDQTFNTSSVFSPTDDSALTDSCESSDTAAVLDRLNYMHVPQPAPFLTIPVFRRQQFSLAQPPQKEASQVMDASPAESVWTPFGLPQGACGVSFNVPSDTEGMTLSMKELVSCASADRPADSFFIEIVETASRHSQAPPSSILLSITPKKDVPRTQVIAANSNNRDENRDNTLTLSGSCGGSGLCAIRQLRITTPTPPLQPRPTLSSLLKPHPPAADGGFQRPSHSLRHLGHDGAQEAAVVRDAAVTSPTEAGSPLSKGPARRATQPCVPSFAAHTPMYSSVFTQRTGSRRMPRGPAFFPTWSARKNVAVPPPQLPEEILYEDLFDAECDGSYEDHFSLAVQQPTR